MVPAEIAERHLTNPSGDVALCRVVTAIEEGGVAVAVFSGVDAAQRAEDYAKARGYRPIHRSLLGEPGKYFERGAALVERAN